MADKDQAIRERAYRIWEEEGRPEGRHADHWSQAESEVHEGIVAEGAQGGQGTELTRTDQAEAPAAEAAGEIHEASDAVGTARRLSQGDELSPNPTDRSGQEKRG